MSIIIDGMDQVYILSDNIYNVFFLSVITIINSRIAKFHIMVLKANLDNML